MAVPGGGGHENRSTMTASCPSMPCHAMRTVLPVTARRARRGSGKALHDRGSDAGCRPHRERPFRRSRESDPAARAASAR